MKACPLCKSTYDDWIDFCFNDGIPLVAHSAAAVSGGGLESILDAPDVPLSLMDAPEPAALKRPPEPVEAPAAKPLVVGAAGFEVGPAPAPEPAPPPAPAPVVPGGMDSAAVAELASVLGTAAAPIGAAVTPPPLVEMPLPSGFALPQAPEPSSTAAPVAVPGPPLASAPVVPSLPSTPSPVAKPPRDDDTGGGSFPLSPLAVAGIALAALAAAGVIWVVIRPTGTTATETEVADARPPTPPVEAAPTPPPAAVPPPAEPTLPPEPVPAAAPVVGVAVTPPPVAVVPVAPTGTPPAPATPAPAVTAVAAVSPPTSAEPTPWGSTGTQAAPSSGTLRVLTDPEGATVTVDDQPRGLSPVNLDLPFGTHRVKVERSGFKAEAREIDLQGPEITVPFNLKPEVLTGQVNVYGPIGWRVAVDGHDMGPMPVTVQMAEGVRQFKLTGDNGQGCVIPRQLTFRNPGKPETVTLECPQ